MDCPVISPEPFIGKCKSLAASKNCYLDVADGRVRLAWVSPIDGSVDFMERAEVIGLDISYDMLLDALSDAGVTIDSDGHYPINEAIKQRLKKLGLYR